MSALMAPLIPDVKKTSTVRLRAVVPAQSRLARVPFIVVLTLILVAGMVGVLILNTTIQSMSQDLRTLQSQASALEKQHLELTAEVNQARSVGSLAQQASELGMRPNPYPSYVHLGDGTVSGLMYRVNGTELPNQSWNGAVPQSNLPTVQVVPLSTGATAAADATTDPASTDGTAADTTDDATAADPDATAADAAPPATDEPTGGGQ